MMISNLGIGFSGQAIVDYGIPDLFHLMGFENQNQRQSPRSYKPRVGHPRRIELRAEETEKSLFFFGPSVPGQFQCRRGAARKVAVRVKLMFLVVVAAKGIANAAIAPINAPKMANSTFWFVYESTTPAMLMI